MRRISALYAFILEGSWTKVGLKVFQCVLIDSLYNTFPFKCHNGMSEIKCANFPFLTVVRYKIPPTLPPHPTLIHCRRSHTFLS